MLNEIMLLNGLGGNKMASRTKSYGTVYDVYSGRYVKRPRSRRRARTTSGLGNLGAFGTGSSIKSTLSSVKGVVITGSIAAGGAIVTDKVFAMIGDNLNLDGWKREAAKIATGIALGILIAKLLKKPKIAAAFAIGPVVSGMLNIFGEVMASQGSTAGLGLTTYQPVDNAYNNMYSPLMGNEDLGLTTFEPVNTLEMPGQRMNAAVPVL